MKSSSINRRDDSMKMAGLMPDECPEGNEISYIAFKDNNPSLNRKQTLKAEDHKNKIFSPLDHLIPKVFKRAADIILSMIVIFLVLTWFIPLIALLIKIDSKGPVFFLQKRNGRNGKLFTCLKFRSMILNDESDLTPVWKYDQRITHLGSILRKYHLDEFPQFLNVLWGNMTLVGPRPHMVSENQIYESLIPNYSLRYRVKPGITGLGQVNNGILTTPLRKMEIRIYWDTFYIINWKPGMDTLILYRTLIYFLNTLNIFQPSEALLGKVAAK